MSEQLIADYLIKTRKLTLLARKEKSARDELLVEIQKLKEEAQEETTHAFFEGEAAFYSGNHEHALKYYLKTTSLPQHQLFCYRTSAYLSKARGLTDKATNFAKEALKIDPKDYASLLILQELMETTEQHEMAKTLRAQIEEVERELQPVQEKEKPPSSSEVQDLSPSTNNSLEQKRTQFRNRQKLAVDSYMQQAEKRKVIPDNTLFMLNGFALCNKDAEIPTQLTREAYLPSCGFYLRWNGKGIVINPGVHFLKAFHQTGLHLVDIDAIIVTHSDPNSWCDIKALYDLIYQTNQRTGKLKLIHYYLNQGAYQQLTSFLKPNFKQERNTIHCLELFLDSPNVESVEVTEELTLHYFPTIDREKSSSPSLSQLSNSPIGVRIDCKQSKEPPIRLGYLSATPWTPFLSRHLGPCDLLITGFGTTSPNDYEKLQYNEDSLGYFGSYTLAQEVKPQLLLLSEFNGQEGDLRLEVVKKMKQDFAKNSTKQAPSPTLLPADRGLQIDLTTLQIYCSLTGQFIPAHNTLVTKTTNSFGPLNYLSRECYTDAGTGCSHSSS